ncbi:hypothetical protein [Marilutibacter aestuarii]|uniref:Uncharacterized protein n=1 Tax=Marilutibacter aestuarii TaxID=1706195 RepID=A0A508ACG7_9GAMM|nr:hypothetical protein [Lysobacter aestuarii]TQD47609.1 hypothetical protein FKV25_05830 [Lysobacter aestuarii]
MAHRPVSSETNRLARLDTAMDAMETELKRLSPWDGRTPAEGRRAWLGAPSVRFCEQVLDALAMFPEVLPGDLDVRDVRRIMEDELMSIDRLVRRRDRLRRLAAHADAAVHASGGDLMDTVMEVYSLLAHSGRSAGIRPVPGADGKPR